MAGAGGGGPGAQAGILTWVMPAPTVSWKVFAPSARQRMRHAAEPFPSVRACGVPSSASPAPASG